MWGDADGACASLGPGGHLASITSAAEQAQLEALDGGNVWIGLKYEPLFPALLDLDVVCSLTSTALPAAT